MYRDQFLSINEVAVYIHGIQQPKEIRMKEMSVEDKIQIEIEALFDRLDENHNGVISEDELYKAMNASSHGKHSMTEVKEIMKVLDKDNNLTVDRQEFMSFMLEQIKKDIISAEDEMEDLRKSFVQYDLDGNGWLSPTEIK